MRRTTYVIIVLATLSLAFGYTASVGIPVGVPNAHATSRTIMLKGSFATGWNGSNPGPTISVTQGDSVMLNLVSTDGAPHTFVIDVAHAGIIPNPNCAVDKCSSQFSSSTTFMFTADIAAGTYSYYCSIHLQHMIGSLIVHSSTNTGPDFSATSNPIMLTVAQGSSGSATITLTSLNGFTGTVGLSATVFPSGPTVSFSSTSVALLANGSASSSLTVSATSMGLYSTSVPNGAYTVTITETNGSASHSTTIPVNVGSAASGPTTSGSSSSMPAYGSGLSGTALLGAAVAVIALGSVATVVVLRRRRTTA
jgi:FtsP/CotA-like multicopper oxidase with cupredoxin domain